MSPRDNFLEALKEDESFRNSVLRTLLSECELKVSVSVDSGWDDGHERLEVEVSLEKVTPSRWGDSQRESLLDGSGYTLLVKGTVIEESEDNEGDMW